MHLTESPGPSRHFFLGRLMELIEIQAWIGPDQGEHLNIGKIQAPPRASVSFLLVARSFLSDGPLDPFLCDIILCLLEPPCSECLSAPIPRCCRFTAQNEAGASFLTLWPGLLSEVGRDLLLAWHRFEV
jgi:hypothetical protein